MADPSSIMLPLFQGRSCMAPGYNYSSSCLQGGYPTYVVNVSTVAQIQLAVNFARNANLRLVVKNTGHDFNGKASGKGALSIWTHYLKDKAYYPTFQADNGYTGPALKVGAGYQVYEVYELAKANGLTVIGGEAVTVGMAGGYIAGGGHSPLSSFYGMASDQVLAMQVVLADGRFITATAKQNPDVFWMLRGGGGSTIGVVTSVTVKAYPKLLTTTVTFNYTVADAGGADNFWASIQSYIDNMKAFVDAGTYSYYYLGASAYMIGTDYPGSTDYYFRMQSFVAPNMTIAQTPGTSRSLVQQPGQPRCQLYTMVQHCRQFPRPMGSCFSPGIRRCCCCQDCFPSHAKIRIRGPISSQPDLSCAQRCHRTRSLHRRLPHLGHWYRSPSTHR